MGAVNPVRMHEGKMKAVTFKPIALVVIFCFSGLVWPPFIHSQGTVYLSNTNQSVAASSLTGSFGVGFTTGGNSAGYLLDSITLLFADNSTTVLVSAGLYDYSTTTFFGNAVEVGAAGYYTFTPGSPIALTANTPYAISVFPDDPQANVNLSYTTSSNFTSVNSWNIPGLDGSDEPLFAIGATPVEPTPEPGVGSLTCGGILAFAGFRMKQKGYFKFKPEK